MNKRRRGEKLFGAVIVMLMALLALSTVAFADGDSSSYALTIQKKAGTESTVDLAKLKGVKCTFRVEGVKSGGTPFSETVTLTLDEKGEGSAQVDLGSPGVISVVELNPNTKESLESEQKFMLTDISNESHMHVNESNPRTEIDLSKENNWILIEPKAPVAEYPVDRAYKITGPNGYERIVAIKDGESAKIEGLALGHYTIEAQKAPAGFSLDIANPKIQSEAGKPITVHIDSNSGEGTLSIEDDGNTHHFSVKGPGGYEDSFVLPYYNENKEKQLSYQVQHVVEGDYTMLEESYEGQAKFTVYAPKTTYVRQATNNYTFQEGKLTGWSTTKDTSVSAATSKNDYIRFRVYNIKSSKVGENITLQIKGTFVTPPANGKTYVNRTLTNYQPTSDYLLGAAAYMVPGNPVYFGFLKSAGVTTCNVDIRLYKPRVYYYTSNGGEDKIVTVDDRCYIEIEKPQDDNAPEWAWPVFTILDADGNQVTEVKVQPTGGRVKINVPKAGNYTVHQEMQVASPVPFTVSTRCQQNAIDKNATQTATVQGTGSTIRVSKPACEMGTDDLGRQYHFKVTGPSLPSEGVVVALEDGQSFKMRELLEKSGHTVNGDYKPGMYSISAIDGGYAGFDLTYSDSCTLDVASKKDAVVTVTNTYQKVQGAYRVIHEYYDGDVATPDAPNFDGRSGISLFGDKELGGTYTGDGVTKEYFFTKDGTKYEYEYVDALYGHYGRVTDSGRSQGENADEIGIAGPGEFLPDVLEQPGEVSDQPGDAPEEPGDAPEEPGDAPEEPGDAPEEPGDASDGPEETPDVTENVPGQAEEASDQSEETSDQPEGVPGEAGGSPAQLTAEKLPQVMAAPLEGSHSQTDEIADGEDQSGEKQEDSALPIDEALEERDSEIPQAAKEAPLEAGLSFEDTGEYARDGDMQYAEAKKYGEDIIILRYRRKEVKEEPVGSYRVVHRYYHRTSQGDEFEGAYDEGKILAPLDYSVRYTADTVERRTKHTPVGGVPHTYTYEFAVYGLYEPGGGPNAIEDQYHPIDGKDCAYATETGEEVIVLRYYRDEAAYNVVHEYYLRTPTNAAAMPAALEGASEAYSVTGKSGGSEDVKDSEDAKDTEDGEGSDNEGDSDETGDEDFSTYDYTPEGTSEVVMYTGTLNDTYTGLRVEQIPVHEHENREREYTHFMYDYGDLDERGDYAPVANRDSATATMRGEQVIILRYYREVGDAPEPNPAPEEPKEPSHVGGSSGSSHIRPNPVHLVRSPSTADNSRLSVWLFLCLGSGLCLGAALFCARCRKKCGA